VLWSYRDKESCQCLCAFRAFNFFTFESQIEVFLKVLELMPMEGMSWTMHKMLKLAVIEQDEDIATLSAIGIIAIDEATYVQAVTVVNDVWLSWRVLMILEVQ
jgi:hypothetical protein